MSLPSYDELPIDPSKPDGSSWGVWGDGDVFGCLNMLTPERVVAAASLIQEGRLFPMNWKMELPDPPLFGREPHEHGVHWLDNEVGHDDTLSNWNTQSSSQWDGFRHIKSYSHGFYGGVADEDHGVHHWARKGLAGRAVLCDVGRWREAQGRPLVYDEPDPIEPDEIPATLEAQGTEVQEGDVLLIRTGWIEWYEGLDADARAGLSIELKTPGLRPGEATAKMLWDLHVSAVAADNPALECWPPAAHATEEQILNVATDPDSASELFVHFRIIPLLGIPIGEMWELGPLADHCAADGRYETFFTSAPLNLEAGVGTTPNAICIK